MLIDSNKVYQTGKAKQGSIVYKLNPKSCKNKPFCLLMAAIVVPLQKKEQTGSVFSTHFSKKEALKESGAHRLGRGGIAAATPKIGNITLNNHILCTVISRLDNDPSWLK